MSTTLYILRLEGGNVTTIHQEEVGDSSYELYFKSDAGEIYKATVKQWERRDELEASVMRCLVEPMISPLESRGAGASLTLAQGREEDE